METIDHPYLIVGRRRYDRVAADVAIEPRDPFLDRRVVAFCLALPGGQKLHGGWPKVILRRAMAGSLPDAVPCAGAGKEHLGWSATVALMEKMKDRMQLNIEGGWKLSRHMSIWTRFAKLADPTLTTAIQRRSGQGLRRSPVDCLVTPPP
ncbi:MAG: asparagine synthase C-terminal domain-containing protein [Candidatus Competibacteraceae bacterium]